MVWNIETRNLKINNFDILRNERIINYLISFIKPIIKIRPCGSNAKYYSCILKMWFKKFDFWCFWKEIEVSKQQNVFIVCSHFNYLFDLMHCSWCGLFVCCPASMNISYKKRSLLCLHCDSCQCSSMVVFSSIWSISNMTKSLIIEIMSLIYKRYFAQNVVSLFHYSSYFSFWSS